MRKLSYLLPILLICAAHAGGAVETIAKSFSVNPGGTLELDMRSGGSVAVTGWEKNVIQIELGDKRNGMRVWSFDFDESGDGLSVEAELEHDINSSNLRAEIKVPHEYSISFHSAGGSLRVSGVAGRFTGETGGGELILKNCKGYADLSTGGGEMMVTDCELDGRMATGGGEVLVQNVVGNLRASSGGGAVRYENVRTRGGDITVPGHEKLKASSQTVVIKNAGGRIHLEDAPEGAVLVTGGGDIQVDSVDEFAVATTGGGDIAVHLEEGWVKATTGAGDIEVSILATGGDDDIVLATGYGNITLTVPKDSGLEFDIDVSYTRSSGRNFKIQSDLDMTIEETAEWKKESGGNWRKHIYGTGKINGGGQKVSIRTTNGNVRIKTP